LRLRLEHFNWVYGPSDQTFQRVFRTHLVHCIWCLWSRTKVNWEDTANTLDDTLWKVLHRLPMVTEISVKLCDDSRCLDVVSNKSQIWWHVFSSPTTLTTTWPPITSLYMFCFVLIATKMAQTLHRTINYGTACFNWIKQSFRTCSIVPAGHLSTRMHIGPEYNHFNACIKINSIYVITTAVSLAQK
jgi:hypothetical protein